MPLASELQFKVGTASLGLLIRIRQVSALRSKCDACLENIAIGISAFSLSGWLLQYFLCVQFKPMIANWLTLKSKELWAREHLKQELESICAMPSPDARRAIATVKTFVHRSERKLLAELRSEIETHILDR